MPTTSILLGLALAIVVLPFVLEPFTRRGRGQRPSQAVAGDPAALSKSAALVAVRDLDFDFQTGKVTEADYRPLRQQLLLTAAEAAQRERPTRPRAHHQADGDSEIEAAVQAARQSGQPAAERACAACGHAAAAADKFCGRCGAAFDQVCLVCQAPVQSSDFFCAHCGARIDKPVVFQQ